MALVLALVIIVPAIWGSAHASAATYAKVVFHGSRARPIVALTFDDGWTGSGALRIARVLLAKEASATFFPYGPAVWQSPAIFNWIAAQPRFEIANHTATHDILCRVTSSGCVSTGVSLSREINGGRTIVAGLTGRRMLPVLRPPGGNRNAAVRAAATSAGFPTIALWDVTAADTAVRYARGVRLRMAKATSGSIVLAHMGPTTTMAALPSAIDAIRAKGLRFVTMSQLLKITKEPPLPVQDYATGGFGPPGVGPRWQASEAIDATGARHLAWTSPDGVWYATDASGDWVEEQIGTSTTGVSYYEQPSIALRSDGSPVVAMTLEDETATTIMIASRGLEGWTSSPVPGQRGFASAPSIAVSDTGVSVAYREQGRWDPATRSWPDEGLYLASDIGGSWNTQRFSMEGPDQSPSLSIDPTTFRPVVAFRARTKSSMLARGTYLAIRGPTGWTYTKVSDREAYPSLRISASGRRYVLLSDAMSTHLSYGSARPGHAFSWRTIGYGLQGSLVKPGRVVATRTTSGRSALEEIDF